ncbi:MAG: beta-eliminating lyase-related protein [Opitutaceae bacterium]
MRVPANYTFASDNTAGICPEAWAALVAANAGHVPSYGADRWTRRLNRLFGKIFEKECEVFLVFNGTAANALALSALCRSFNSILCHRVSHADVDECGAPEFFTGGSKVIALDGPNGKLLPATFEAALHRGHGVHYPKPGALSLTQSTELGSVYTPAEVRALAKVAHTHGLGVHMDGARFANAMAALGSRGFSPADCTWRAGVDVLSFGGTKNGMHSTEAVVFFNRTYSREFEYRVKQGGQLASKMRFAAAQWEAMLRDGAWLRHAAAANARTRALARAIRALPSLRLLVKPEVNGVFVAMPPAVYAALERRGWHFYRFIGEHGYRLMCAWDTRASDVAAFIADLQVAVRTSKARKPGTKKPPAK